MFFIHSFGHSDHSNTRMRNGATTLGNASPFYLPSRMKMIGCKEFFVEFPIDAQLARQVVPQSFEIQTYPNGSAMLLIMIQDWDKCILDGILPIKRVKMSHIWIELDGPQEIGPPLPGTASSLPTSYYYALPHQIDNRLAVLAFKLAGIDVHLVRKIDLQGNFGVHQIVRVTEGDNPTTGYSWEFTPDMWSTPNIVTGRRWFYRNYGSRLKRKSTGLVVCRSSFLASTPVEMSVDRGSVMDRLGFSGKISGRLQLVTTDCDCWIRVGMDKGSSSPFS